MIRVVLVDDQDLVRAGLRALLANDPAIEVVGEAADARTGLARVRDLRPDVVLMDIRMPGGSGLGAVAAIRADPTLARVRVLILTTFDDDAEIIEAVTLGAAGYLLKDTTAADLRAAVRTVAGGNNVLSPAVTRQVMDRLAVTPRPPEPDPRLAALTDRERAVLARIGNGDTNEEIARALFISPATARTYVSRILTKLDARDRTQLAIIALRSGLGEEPGPGGPRG